MELPINADYAFKLYSFYSFFVYVLIFISIY